MAEEKEKSVTRKKPSFLRKDWHKKIKLGSTVKKKRKWRFPNGRQNKLRLNRKGHTQRPKVGWGNEKEVQPIRIENLAQLKLVNKENSIVIASVGKKKREEIIAKANELGILITNRYRRKE